jgi:antitoxin MazE
MKSKIQKWGNSLAVRIPKTFAEEVGLSDDTPIEMRLVKGGLVIEPLAEYVPSLETLLSRVTDENKHDEVEWGPAVGQELW